MTFTCGGDDVLSVKPTRGRCIFPGVFNILQLVQLLTYAVVILTLPVLQIVNSSWIVC